MDDHRDDTNEALDNKTEQTIENATPEKTTDSQKPLGLVFLILGVVYPAIVIVFELSTRMCAMEFFDPMPSFLHTIVIATVPAGNLLVWLALKQEINLQPKWLGMIVGFSILISLYYTILFLPLIPLALIGIIWLIGLLPLAPIVSFICAIVAYRRLGNMYLKDGFFKVPGVTWGLIFGVIAMLALDIQGTITVLGMEMAGSNQSVSQRTFGIRVLRAVGDEELMLRTCYKRRGLYGSLLRVVFPSQQSVSPLQARRIYYRVTGMPFNSLPIPHRIVGRRGSFGLRGFDSGMGGDSVASRVGGLSLKDSRIDGSVDARAALTYLEWTLVFQNHSARQQEARAQLGLPPGGIVTRLTLWVDNEEREAVFAHRQEVKRAYKNIVRRKRDPVLVTTTSPNRALVQCFPVPPNGGVMKVRIGISAPLFLLKESQAVLKLPCIVERNFEIPESFKHSIWLESKDTLISPAEFLPQEHPSENLYAIRGKVKDSVLLRNNLHIGAHRSSNAEEVWSLDSTNESKTIIIQKIVRHEPVRPKKAIVVIDGSAGMRAYRDQVVTMMSNIPDDVQLTVLIASDELVRITASSNDLKHTVRAKAIKILNSFRFVGGRDNISALTSALDLAIKQSETAIIWVHGPQPILLGSVESILQRLQRRPGRMGLYSVEVKPGPNRIAEKIGWKKEFHVVPRLGNLSSDLARTLYPKSPFGREIMLVREKLVGSEKQVLASLPKTSDHLIKLWANDQLMKLYHSDTKEGRVEAVKLAQQYRLVTPVSGAVVLETDADYVRAGLKPPGKVHVPTIPEPETWALIVIAIMMFLYLVFRSRFAWLFV